MGYGVIGNREFRFRFTVYANWRIQSLCISFSLSNELKISILMSCSQVGPSSAFDGQRNMEFDS